MLRNRHHRTVNNLSYFLPVVFIMFVMFCCNNCSAKSEDDSTCCFGTYHTDRHSDTVIITFRFILKECDPDSIMIKLSDHSGNLRTSLNNYQDTPAVAVVYRKAETVPFRDDWRAVESDSRGIWFSGTVKILKEGSDDFWLLALRAYSTNSNGTVSFVDRDEFIGSLDGAIGMEIIAPSFGYLHSSLAPPLDKQTLFLGWGLAWEMSNRRWRWVNSTSWSGFGSISFSEPYRSGFRYYTGTRDNFMPQFYTAIKLAKLKIKEGDTEFRRVQWGGEFGLAFEGPFERIGYHYSTALGGYHTAELYLAFASGSRHKIGTRYLFETNGDVWMVRVSFHVEGLPILTPSRVFHRLNKRPLPHKILACAGLLPSAIIAVPGSLLGIGKGHTNAGD